MINSEFRGIKIAGMMTAVPKQKQVLAQQYNSVFGEKEVEKFSKTTGVVERYITPIEQTSSDLAFVAARELLSKKGINKSEIGVLLYITQTPDYRIPSTACVLHKRLELTKDCLAFDINLGCSGYVYGMQTTCALLRSMNCKYALLMVGDTMNKEIAPADKSSAMLFGDSGAATLLEKADAAVPPIKTALRTDGTGFKAIIIPSGAYRNTAASHKRTVWAVDGNERSDYDLYMNGVDVFSFTISEVPAIINEYIEMQDEDRESYDGYIFHQANCYIIKQVVKRSKLPKDKVPISMDRYGNTSVTSIPLTICDTYADVDDKDVHLLICGFGIGLSWGIADITLNCADIYPIIKTDEVYNDGGVSHD